jgi:class 3 adenylate cyclase/predicted ATPase
MHCSKCGSENPAGNNFCVRCKSELIGPCAECGAENSVTSQFCGECGAPLGAPLSLSLAATTSDLARELNGEWRHLTILFCDLVGSTRLTERLDPEEWLATVADYQHAVAERITRFAGQGEDQVVRYVGDGIMALFGYPVAHDNDAERAVRAGLAILGAIEKLNEQGGHAELSVRIGISSGRVVVGTGAGKEMDVFGPAANIAARVETAAEPGTVLISHATQRLIAGRFIVQDRGAQELKGIDRPVQLYRVIRPGGTPPSATGALTPFVGREEELHLLGKRWERVCEGEGQVVTIVGEPGIGKSRLLQHFHKRLAERPHTWSEAAAGPFFQNTPFYPVSEMLHQFVGDTAGPEQLAELARRLTAVGLAPTEAIPLIAPLLNLPLPPEYPPSPLSPEQQRRRLLATLIEWVLESAREQPLVIVTEDLHWADPSTLELIQLLVEQGATERLLLLYTARPEFRAPWAMRAHHTQITLNRLSASQVRTMVAEVAAQKALSDETIATVVERSTGVPFFVEELTRFVLESDDPKLARSEIPVTVQDSLMARLDRLGPLAKEIAQIGAVIGRGFSYELLRAVHPVAEADLERTLRSLADAELLYPRGIEPEAIYQFKHALIQDVAYQSLLRGKRRQYHRQIAEALEQGLGRAAEARPELLAHHYTEADLKEPAIRQWQIAGHNAVQRSANAEAVSQLTKALELLNQMPVTPERFNQELALQLALGTPLVATRGIASPEVGKVYARARELCRQAGEAPQLFPVLWGLWVFYTARADHEVARELADQCLRLAEKARDPDLLLEAHHALGVTLTALAEFAPALEQLDQVIVNYDPVRHGSFGFLYGQDPKVACLAQSTWALWLHGFPDRALRRTDEAITLARELSHPYSLALALSFGAIVHQLNQDQSAVQECAEALIKLATEKDFAMWTPWGLVLRGWALSQSGESAEGICQIREGVAAFRATGAEVMVPYFLGLLADAYRKSGQAEEGLSVLAEAQAVIDRSRECWWESELYRLKGEFTLMRGGGQNSTLQDEKAAEQYFHQALNIATRQTARLLELRAAMSLSGLWQKQGKKAEARRMLLDIYGSLTEGFKTTDLQQTERLLEELL